MISVYCMDANSMLIYMQAGMCVCLAFSTFLHHWRIINMCAPIAFSTLQHDCGTLTSSTLSQYVLMTTVHMKKWCQCCLRNHSKAGSRSAYIAFHLLHRLWLSTPAAQIVVRCPNTYCFHAPSQKPAAKNMQLDLLHTLHQHCTENWASHDEL